MSAVLDVAVKRINKVEGTSATRAYCDVAIGGAYLIKGLKVVNGKNGLFVSMPSEQGKNGQWYDTLVPLTKEARDRLSQIVLEAFHADVETGVAA